jgi:hypothetical protein
MQNEPSPPQFPAQVNPPTRPRLRGRPAGHDDDTTLQQSVPERPGIDRSRHILRQLENLIPIQKLTESVREELHKLFNEHDVTQFAFIAEQLATDVGLSNTLLTTQKEAPLNVERQTQLETELYLHRKSIIVRSNEIGAKYLTHAEQLVCEAVAHVATSERTTMAREDKLAYHVREKLLFEQTQLVQDKYRVEQQRLAAIKRQEALVRMLKKSECCPLLIGIQYYILVAH